MTVGVKQWLDCEFVLTHWTGKELRYRMFVSTGNQLYAVIDHNGTSRRVRAEEHGGKVWYAVVIRSNVLRGKIRVRAPGLLWLQDQTAGYMAFMRNASTWPPSDLIGVRAALWRKGWAAAYDMNKGVAP